MNKEKNNLKTVDLILDDDQSANLEENEFIEFFSKIFETIYLPKKARIKSS